MLINDVTMLVTNATVKKLDDGKEYARVGLLSMDDGQKFELTVYDQEVYSKLAPMTIATMDVGFISSKGIIKMVIDSISEYGKTIA